MSSRHSTDSKLRHPIQSSLPAFAAAEGGHSSTFVGNLRLPVHRWFRYSAGFSAAWAEATIRQHRSKGNTRVLDPFVGSGTTLLASQAVGADCIGIEAHPFVLRVARAKLSWLTDAKQFLERAAAVRRHAMRVRANLDGYPTLIRACYDDETLKRLDALRRAYELQRDDSPTSELVWLALVACLRRASHAGTAQWQYVLPKKSKLRPTDPLVAFDGMVDMIYGDMRAAPNRALPDPRLLSSDARTCAGVPDGSVSLVVTSPPYPNNYDYADATRLEMSFMGEVSGWGQLQSAVRRHLVCSCSQHVPERTVQLNEVLRSPELAPIVDELAPVCAELAAIRESRGGRKTYHLMVACYFRDLAQTWLALSRVCGEAARACFVIGDSAPYGVYVPVIPWMGKLALAAGFSRWSFEKTRDRNIKWKNRKHRVPLQEGCLWVER
jgi:hypothetical protein